MTHAIARRARKHGYDSITYQSAKNENGICTVIFNPNRVKVTDVMEVKITMFTPVMLDNYILTRWECTCNACGKSFLIYNSEWNELVDLYCSDNLIRFLPLDVPHGYVGFIWALGFGDKDILPKDQVVIDELISSMAPYRVKLLDRQCPACGKHDYRIISSITEKNMPMQWVELDFELYDSMVNQVPRPNLFEIWKSEYREIESSVAEKNFCLADFVNKLKHV